MTIKVGDIDLDSFQILRIRVECVISVLRRLFLGGGSITCGIYSDQPFVECLKGF